ncbi:MAG TPA: arginine repressor [Thermoclostridium caenicola]|uniref:Arginine repressor n=1 Tax=Thermoclostridium caenicola TaxID=659425 RepID=A0A1M6FV13_9FIRM|nr:arginine repressor [Thermoclostridium caenicola]SHJ01513.1 transcriptional regulator, ArgR family [Thermoclostridium caenicola]HOK42281.1 arginine repressor [Thermoclostridium caenicola]HOL85190.1 arginine repressor [Thermoclostridium caenicola]HOP72924.1 arginine repressor [Thermoclostridium caenicola]HPO76760.1 arginine repressor [Thermoclostridium caenicola]
MKYNRHAKILDIIEKHEIETQDELAEKLRELGMDVTQATISRDIKELRLVKVLSPSGKYKYSAMNHESANTGERLMVILKEAFVSCDYANNILVVKTLPGMAQAVGEIVDSLGWNEVVGTIAGDNTLMIVCRAEKIAEELMEKFTRMVKGVS